MKNLLSQTLIFLFLYTAIGHFASAREEIEDDTQCAPWKSADSASTRVAPGFISTHNLEIMGLFAPGMNEFYFVRQVKGEPPRNLVVRCQNGVWTGPFEEQHSGQVSISPDGSVMHLGDKFRDRTPLGWSKEQSIDAPLDDVEIMRLTSSSAGTYFFDERDDIGTIRYSKLKDGVRERPRTLGDTVNDGTFTAHPYIAPDESFLIWDSVREGGFGDSDLYISFRLQDGTWSDAINMGPEINTEFEDAYGSVTPDGNFLVFHTVFLGNTFDDSFADIHWINARVIDGLRKSHLDAID